MYVWKVYRKDKERGTRSTSRRKGEWVVRTSDCGAALKTSWRSQWGIPVPLWRNYSSKMIRPQSLVKLLGESISEAWKMRWNPKLPQQTLSPVSVSFHFLYRIFQIRDIFINSSLSIFIVLWSMVFVLYLRNFCLTQGCINFILSFF